MEPKCVRMMSILLPSIRASVAQELYTKYNYKQEDIASSLGIVQVAVSKYIHDKYSSRMKEVKDFIISKGLSQDIVNAVIANKDRAEINQKIEELCNNAALLEFAR